MALTLPDLRKARKTKSIVYLKLNQDRSLVYRKKNPHFPYYDRYLLKLCILIPGGKGFERGGGGRKVMKLPWQGWYFTLVGHIGDKTDIFC